MSLELELQQFPKDTKIKDGSKVKLRPLKRTDEKAFHALFQTIPEQERMFIKHRVTDIAVIRDWCEAIDLWDVVVVEGLGRLLGVAQLFKLRDAGQHVIICCVAVDSMIVFFS